MVFGEPLPYRFKNLADHFAAVAARHLQGLGQNGVAVGVQIFKTQVLQFMVKVIQAEPVGDRRIDLHGLARDALALVLRHGPQRAHVVQTVGQLDQDDAHVARHRQQHLAEVFGLRIFLGLEPEAVEFAQSVDQFCDRFPEFLGDLLGSDFGVFDDIVQQRRDDRLRIDVQRCEDARYGNRVGDVRVAGMAHLALMRHAAEFDRLTDVLDVLRFKIGGEFLDQ